MAHMDIFKNKAFSLVSMLSAIDNVEYRPMRMRQMKLTEVRPVRTKTVSIEMRTEKGIGLIQTTPRGAPLVKAGGDDRNIRDFRTVRIGEFDNIYADEIQDIRAFGSESELMQVQQEIARRLQRLEDDISLTEENMLLGMAQGKVVDADGSVIYDWFEEMGVAQAAEINWDFPNATLHDLRLKCRNLKRRMQKNAKGAVFSGVRALCGDDFYDQLTTHSEIEKTYLNQQEAAKLRADSEGAEYESFYFGGITFENYRGTDDGSTVAIAATEAKFFPDRSRGIFVEALAPGESFDVVNRPGRRRYAQVIPDRDRNEFVRVEAKSYPLHICQIPAVLERGRAA